MSNGSVADPQVALTTYSDQYIYLHTIFWQIFYRATFAILFVLAIPILYAAEAGTVGVYYFPLSATIVTVGGWWLLGAHYNRMEKVRTKIDKLRGGSPWPDRDEKGRDKLTNKPRGLFEYAIGPMLYWFFLCIGLIMSIGEIILINNGILTTPNGTQASIITNPSPCI